MQASGPSLLALCLGLILLCATSGSGEQRRCRVDTLRALEPAQRFEAEAGVTEFYDEGEGQLQCAGVSVARVRIEPNGLLLPSYSNSHRLVYLPQGRAIMGLLFPGCPETFQDMQSRQPEQWRRRAASGRDERRRSGQEWREGSEEEGEEGSVGEALRDEYQRTRRVREGDVIAIPAGVPFWVYNDAEIPLIAVSVSDVANDANQLDATNRDFLLAGNGNGNNYSNILSGLDREMLAEAFGVSNETMRRIQGRLDQRGRMVRLGSGSPRMLRLARQRRWEEEEEAAGNGLDEDLCWTKMRENIADPMQADIYTPSGNITVLNSQKLPVLKLIQMSASRGVMRQNAILAPHWNNAHEVVYATSGSERLQVVSNKGRRAFDGELRSGQLLVVPQGFVVFSQARAEEGFSWVSFHTSENAISTPVVGKTSALRGMPADVLANAYNVSMDEARRIKSFRDREIAIFSPVSTSNSRPEMLATVAT